MSRTRLKQWRWWSLAVLLGAATLAWTQSDPLPLGDVARQKPARKARFVITNDDLPPNPEPLPAKNSITLSTSADEGNPAAKTEPAGVKAEGKAAHPDLETVSDARKTLEQLLRHQQFLADQVNALQEQIEAGPREGRRDVLVDMLRAKSSDLQDVQAQVRKAQEDLLAAIRDAEKASKETPKKEDAPETSSAPAAEEKAGRSEHGGESSTGAPK